MRRMRFKRKRKVDGRGEGKGEREIGSEALPETEKNGVPLPFLLPSTFRLCIKHFVMMKLKVIPMNIFQIAFVELVSWAQRK